MPQQPFPSRLPFAGKSTAVCAITAVIRDEAPMRSRWRQRKPVYDCRAAAAELFGISSPDRIVFTYNTTYALNMAIKGLLHRGDHVLISDMEHNAVYRPIWALANFGEITFDIFSTGCVNPDRTDADVLASIEAGCKLNTRMVIVSHVSNLCSASLPIGAIGRFCRERGLLFVVDAAQSAGIEDIDCEAMCIDALCAPGHKGLYGPQGTGLLAIREGLTLATLMEGGNGINSLEPAMPDFSPERYEAGTLATPGAGWAAGRHSLCPRQRNGGNPCRRAGTLSAASGGVGQYEWCYTICALARRLYPALQS